MAVRFRRISRSADSGKCRHHVHEMARLAIVCRDGLIAVRPSHDERCRDAAFMHPMLIQPERRVARIGPWQAVALIRVFVSRHIGGQIADLTGDPSRVFFGMCRPRALGPSSSAQPPLSDMNRRACCLPARSRDRRRRILPMFWSSRSTMAAYTAMRSDLPFLIRASFHAGAVVSRGDRSQRSGSSPAFNCRRAALRGARPSRSCTGLDTSQFLHRAREAANAAP